MQINNLICPSCGAKIDLNIKDRKSMFCPFCGSLFAVDDESLTINENININERYTNDAAVEAERRKDRENERSHSEIKWILIGSFSLIVFLLVFVLFETIKENWNEKKAIDAGMIKVGQSSSDMEGKKYNAIVAQLESAGFTDIITIDLNDAGWFTNKANTVESVSIGGNTSFSFDDYFDPDSTVVVSYH